MTRKQRNRLSLLSSVVLTFLAAAAAIPAHLPRLTLATEFAFEKNGIRFPSSCSIEEAYAFEAGVNLVRSRTKITHTDYKFFTVETGVAIR